MTPIASELGRVEDGKGRGGPGFSLLEVLLALFLLSLVVQGGLAVFSQFRSAAGRVAQRAEGLETVRTIAWLLPEELSGGRPGRDWWAATGDSVSVRAFRGLAMVSPGFVGGGRDACLLSGNSEPESREGLRPPPGDGWPVAVT